MSYARSAHEDVFVTGYLQKEIRALGVSADMQRKFLNFAVEHGGADRTKLRPRLYHVIKGRTPSAYLAILLVRFFNERRYEDFVRTTKDHIAYLTSDGDTAALEKLVASHPLILRIVQVRMTTWMVTGKPNDVRILLRSPFDKPVDDDAIDQRTGLDQLNAQLFYFQRWLAKEADVPTTFIIKPGVSLPVRHDPEWLLLTDEAGFEHDSEAQGTMDVTTGVYLLAYAKWGAESPDIPSGLDIFYHLSDLFQGTDAKPAPAELSFDSYWPRIVDCGSNIAEVFFSRIDQFPRNVRGPLERFFQKFAQEHRAWVKKALADKQLCGRDDYAPRPEDVTHYEQVTHVFFEQFRPVLRRCWSSFAKAAINVLDGERPRAREHFEKMKKRFG